MNSNQQPTTYDRVFAALFLALIFSLGFMQPDIKIGGSSVTLTDGLFLLTGAVWAVGLAVGKISFRWDSAFYLFTVYAAALCFAAVLSVDRGVSFRKLPAELYLIALAFLTFIAVRSADFLRRVVIVWLAASAVVTLIGTLAVVSYYLGLSNFITGFALHHYGSLPPGNYPRIQGTFFYPSLLCNYLTVSVMMLLAAYVHGWVRKQMFAILLVLFSVTVAFTLTPGIGGVLLAIGLWFWIIDSNRSATSRSTLAGGLLAATLFLLVSTFSLFRSPTSPYSFEIAGLHIEPSQRLLTWTGAAETFLSHPIFGKGLGLPAASVTFMPPSGQAQLLTDAHNTFLNVAAQSGLVGLVGICLAAIVILRRAFARGMDQPLILALGIAFLSAFVYQGLVGSFENARHLWVLMGLILAVTNMPEEDRPADT